MYIEFKHTHFDVHIWDKKGAMTRLTGAEILAYVCFPFLLSCVEWGESRCTFRILYWYSDCLEYRVVTHLLFLLPTSLSAVELSPEEQETRDVKETKQYSKEIERFLFI